VLKSYRTHSSAFVSEFVSCLRTALKIEVPVASEVASGKEFHLALPDILTMILLVLLLNLHSVGVTLTFGHSVVKFKLVIPEHLPVFSQQYGYMYCKHASEGFTS